MSGASLYVERAVGGTVALAASRAGAVTGHTVVCTSSEV
jgi:hypothetical protein